MKPIATPITVMSLSLGMFLVIAWFGWDTYVTRPTPQVPTSNPTVRTGDPILLAVGDIASCGSSADEAVGGMLATVPGSIATLGDTVYDRGSQKEFAECFEPTWGSLRDRIRPAVGNHEYTTGQAEPYYAYFGTAAGPAGAGYYSYRLGSWNIYVLNSNCGEAGGCDVGSPQLEWLQAEFAASHSRCSLAYFHHPRWSSGLHGSNAFLQPVWEALADGGVDVVLNGHDHTYERFAPLDRDGLVSSAGGTREFIVGTGGRSLYPFKTIATGSEVRQDDTYGALRLQLHVDGYSWEFLAATGPDFTDRGSDRCH